jgi:hypothetical protein
MSAAPLTRNRPTRIQCAGRAPRSTRERDALTREVIATTRTPAARPPAGSGRPHQAGTPRLTRTLPGGAPGSPPPGAKPSRAALPESRADLAGSQAAREWGTLISRVDGLTASLAAVRVGPPQRPHGGLGTDLDRAVARLRAEATQFAGRFTAPTPRSEAPAQLPGTARPGPAAAVDCLSWLVCAQ